MSYMSLLIATFAPGASNAAWLRSELSRLSLLAPISLRTFHLTSAINYHLNPDPDFATNLTLATFDDALVAAAAWQVGFDALGQECLMLGALASTGSIPGAGAALLRTLAHQALALALPISCVADAAARGFYLRLGFIQDPPYDVRYVWPLSAMRSALSQEVPTL